MDHQNQYVEIGVGEERYAIKIGEIQEIIKMQTVTAIPSNKDYILGVMSLRGKIIPVVSLRTKLGMPAQEHGRSTRIVVINHHEEMVGLVVDRVVRVTSMTNVQPPPDGLHADRRSYVKGIEGDGQDLIGILDLELLLQE